MLVCCDRKHRGVATCLVIALGWLAQHAALLLDDNMKACYPRSIRLKGYDYAQAGAYFVTICTHGQRRLLGEIVDGKMMVSAYGEIAKACLEEIPNHFAHAEIDAFVVMPNHLHGIIVITHGTHVEAQHAAPLHGSVNTPRPGSLSAIVRSFKSASTRRINELRRMPGGLVWQRNYYENVIRKDHDLERIREYIATNPLRWALDRENPLIRGRSAKEDAVLGFDQTS